MKAKANYYGGLSNLIDPAQLAGPGPPGALARCNLQAMLGEGGRGRRMGGKAGRWTGWRGGHGEGKLWAQGLWPLVGIAPRRAALPAMTAPPRR